MVLSGAPNRTRRFALSPMWAPTIDKVPGMCRRRPLNDHYRDPRPSRFHSRLLSLGIARCRAARQAPPMRVTPNTLECPVGYLGGDGFLETIGMQRFAA